MLSNEFESINNTPLVKTFIEKFGGDFVMNVHGLVMYLNNDRKTFHIPDTVTTFIDVISKSIKQEKNILLSFPTEKLPSGAVE